MLQNWGEMNKAQDNPQTIDEAIASAISAHEADPESHMGSGESIENHRINEVIDHPASSIVPDKFSNNQPSYYNSFVSATDYSNSGLVGQGGQGYISLLCSTTYRTSEVEIPIPNIDWSSFPDTDMLFDFVTWIHKYSSPVFSGTFAVGDKMNGFGIDFNQTQWRAWVAIDDTVTYSAYSTIDIFKNCKWRFFLDSISGSVLFFLDGVQIFSIAVSGSGFSLYNIFGCRLSWTSGGSTEFLVSMFRGYYNF